MEVADCRRFRYCARPNYWIIRICGVAAVGGGFASLMNQSGGVRGAAGSGKEGHIIVIQS